jgi:hypothetical protein
MLEDCRQGDVGPLRFRRWAAGSARRKIRQVLADRLLTFAVNKEQPVFGDWTFHALGLWLAAGFAIFASITALILIFLHATHYSRPWEQKQYDSPSGRLD